MGHAVGHVSRTIGLFATLREASRLSHILGRLQNPHWYIALAVITLCTTDARCNRRPVLEIRISILDLPITRGRVKCILVVDAHGPIVVDHSMVVEVAFMLLSRHALCSVAGGKGEAGWIAGTLGAAAVERVRCIFFVKVRKVGVEANATAGGIVCEADGLGDGDAGGGEEGEKGSHYEDVRGSERLTLLETLLGMVFLKVFG